MCVTQDLGWMVLLGVLVSQRIKCGVEQSQRVEVSHFGLFTCMFRLFLTVHHLSGTYVVALTLCYVLRDVSLLSKMAS